MLEDGGWPFKVELFLGDGGALVKETNPIPDS
jgi:hypothetical protein